MARPRWCSGSCVRSPAFMPGNKDMGKRSRFTFLNHPTGTNGPRCRHFLSDKTGTYACHHVTADHVATAQQPDEAARLPCKVRSSWLGSDQELRPSRRQAKQASQLTGSEVMKKSVCCDDINVRRQLLQELEHVCCNRLHIPTQCGKAVADRSADNILLIDQL